MIILIIIAFFLLLIFAKRNSPKIKGKLSEFRISLMLPLKICTPNIKGKISEFRIASRLLLLDQNNYIILNNVILRTKNEKTVQIDHIVISIYGIFVIETKNYKGWIFGNEAAENWMQIIYREKNQFRNPVKQNWSHIYALKELLSDFPNAKFIPIVAFSINADLKKINSSVPVIYETKILRTIEKESKEEILSHDEIEKIFRIIESSNIESKETEKEHVENIHKTIIERQLREENLICPKCGAELKLRSGKYGKFYGCPNYPYCKFTMKC